jgi:DNA-binding transcriptional LysR family regulator
LGQKEIRIGTCCIAGEHLIPLGLDAFRRTHPEASPSLTITKCEDVFDGLLHGRFDIGVTGLAPKTRDLEKKLLLKAPLLFFAAPTEHGKPRQISVKQLPDQRLILREKGAGCRVELERFCVRHGVPLKNLTVVTESESNEAIIKLVKEGYGIGALPKFMIERHIHDGELSEIILQEGQPLQSFFLTYPKQAPQSLLLRELLSSFKKHAKLTGSFNPTQ